MYMHVYMHISGKFSKKKTPEDNGCARGTELGKRERFHYILFEFWTMWMYYPFIKLKDRERYTQIYSSIFSRVRRRKLLWEGLAKERAVWWLWPLAESSLGLRLLHLLSSWPSQRSLNRLSQPWAACGSKAVSLAKDRVTGSQKCFPFFLLTLRWVEPLPCLHCPLQESRFFQKSLLVSKDPLKSNLWHIWEDRCFNKMGKCLSEVKIIRVQKSKNHRISHSDFNRLPFGIFQISTSICYIYY